MREQPYLVLARKWRPQSFEDVVGQTHITRTLQNAIASGRVGHAFLFIGSRGIGKTTTARVLAKALNCLSSDRATPNPCGECSNCTSITAGTSMDVIEIDGASNNSVDDVRQIRENIRLVPSQSRYKIYVIDEVHQLSPSAFNALLKTLEEPPEHAVFILATTESHKVPATIISRCQRYDFRRVSLDALMALLKRVLENETAKATDEALYAIARAADGGVRDAESILEQLMTYCDGEIQFQDVVDVLGLVDWKVLSDMANATLNQDVGRQLRIIEEVTAGGKDLSQFVQELLGYYRNLLICKTADAGDLLALPESDLAEMRTQAERYSLTTLIRLVEQFAELTKDFDSQLAQRIALESLLIRLSKVSIEMSVDAVLEKLVQLGAGGIGAPPSDVRNLPRRSVGAAVLAEPVAPRSQTPAAATKAPRENTLGAIELSQAETQWPVLMHAVGNRDLGLGVALGHARLCGIDGDALVLGFLPAHTKSRELASRPDKRAVLNEVLQTRTDNLRTVRIETIEPDLTDSRHIELDDPRSQPAATGTTRRGVRKQDVDSMMHDPHIAQVVEVFRGEIVDIRKENGNR